MSRRATTRRSAPNSTGCSAATPAARPCCTARSGSASGQAARCCSSGRTWPTPVRTRSTTCSARRCWPAMGKTRVIAETGAGQHGVATATACALLGLDCVIYMGAVDTARQALNVARMRLLGAEVVSVESGSKTLKDAINEAFRDWVTNADSTYYCFGTAAGPHPFPAMVRDFQRIIGLEARAQIQAQAGRLPDAVVACIGGGSNAIGIFHPFIDDPGVRLVGYEAAGDGVETGRHAATFTGGSPGAFQGSFSYLLQDEDGQTIESHSISAGLDYPGVGPEHAWLREIGRAEYRPITDSEAMDAFRLLCRTEGIIPAIESAHAD